MNYSDKIIEHFGNPRNVGEIARADGAGAIGDPQCGDFLKISIRIENDHIRDMKFLCRGCPTAIATASILTELTMGKHLDEASEVTDEQIAAALGGLPEHKMHCSNLAVEALQEAIMDYILNYPRRAMKELRG